MQEVFEKIINRIEKSVKKSDNSNFTNGLLGAKQIIEQELVEYNNGWIPCNERMPEDGVDVIVWFEYFGYSRQFQKAGISHTYRGEWSDEVNGQYGLRKLRIIAWHPLPEPYEPKGE